MVRTSFFIFLFLFFRLSCFWWSLDKTFGFSEMICELQGQGQQDPKLVQFLLEIIVLIKIKIYFWPQQRKKFVFLL